MTIGDGRFGSDAHFFKSRGVDVLATSLTDDSLRLAAEKGYIDRFSAINAERIDLRGESVDFVYCKEAYHHFPKPPVAFYEMFRVAAKGVILLEPNEERVRPLGWLKAFVKMKLWNQPINFEPCGNFIYRTDPKRIAKMMSACGCEGTVAFRLFNDFYHPAVARQKAEPTSFGFLILRGIIGIQNLLCRLGLMDYAMICLIALKKKPDASLLTKLKNSGFKIINLPENPYKD
jgi:SAM-dependent methyltransferase